ncbi:MAG: thiamine pyrophosphate-requiring protein [Nitrososphaerota archaeon]|nr:thiamine pyrophosphate-requiring protein [Nitrososphaerota archaeon]
MEDNRPVVEVENVAQAILVLMVHSGLECLLLTGGTDLAPIQDGLVKMAAAEANTLKSLNIPHENVSTAMALGYAALRGKPAGVAVHVNVGTSNALGNLMNASRSHTPLILLAGKTPLTEYGHPGSRNLWIHWGQDVFDQHGIVREFVKWDYEIKRIENLPEVIARAFKIANSEPKGPVYLTFGREILMESMREVKLNNPALSNPTHPTETSDEVVGSVFSSLIEAQNPLLIAGSVGRSPQAVKDLQKICDTLGIGVVETVRTFMNCSTQDPMHLGFDPTELVSNSDTIIFLDCPVPWIPSISSPKESANVIQIDEDPLRSDIPMWSFRVNLQVRCDSSSFLRRLREKVESTTFDASSLSRLSERKAKIAQVHERWKEKSRETAILHSSDSPIDMVWLSHEINRAIDENTVIVNEYTLDQNQVEITKPLTYLGQTFSGFLGRGLGQALGAKLASPSSLVIACVGDGSYIFSVPDAAHWVSSTYNLPFLTVIFNNQGWAAERQPIDQLYPKGWSVRNKKYIGVYIDPPGEYSKVVEAFGGYGERVTDPKEVAPALQRAIAHIKTNNKQAVLDVICKKA